MKKKTIIIVVFIIAFIAAFIAVYITTNKMYSYRDYFPGVTYKIRINKITKVLYGNFYHSCSAADCEGTTYKYKYSVKLTNDEYKKIMMIWNDKKSLSPILESLCENDKVFYSSFENSFEDSIEDYNKMYTNSDGKITSREFADNWLDIVIEENQKSKK